MPQWPRTFGARPRARSGLTPGAEPERRRIGRTADGMIDAVAGAADGGATWAQRDRKAGRSRTSVVSVLRLVAANPELRRVELAFAAFKSGEGATWLAMLVYAYAQGGVTESGVVATVMLVPAAALAPVLAAVGTRYAPGKTLTAGYVAQATTCAAAATALLAHAPPLLAYLLFVGPSVAFTMTRPTQSAF